jgi:hypothetical protein
VAEIRTPVANASPEIPIPKTKKVTRPWIIGLIVAILGFDLAFSWQHLADAYHSEFGGHPDEAAHVVTGLFIRDSIVEGFHWMTNGFQRSPVTVGKEFANDYYAHYPKIGLGVWPPVFYLVQSVWTLSLGATTRTLLLLMAVLAGGVGLLVYRGLRDEHGLSAAALGALLVLCLPLVRTYYGMVMAEMLSALFMLGAMLAFGEFLDREQKRHALWFGVLATLAILTKGTGLALALAAPFALLWTRRFHLLKRPSFWVAVLIIVLVAGPWTWATRNLGKGGWLQPEPSWSFVAEALPYYARKFGFALGFATLPFFLVGLAVKLAPRGEHRGRWAACAALVFSILIFQSIAPVGLEARHIIPALAPACMFAVAGLCFAGARWRTGKASDAPAETPPVPSRPGPIFWLGAVVLLAVPCATSPLAQKGCYGFAPLSEAMLSEAAPVEVTLVSSDAAGEGMFIAEVALREHRPGHVIRRASKELASSTWSGSGYTPRFKSDDELFTHLTSGEIRYLVVDENVPAAKRREHHDQLTRVIAAHGERFYHITETEASRSGQIQRASIHFYRIKN